MKNLIFGMLIFASVVLTGCDSCKGPAGENGSTPCDTTVTDSNANSSVQDTLVDTIK